MAPAPTAFPLAVWDCHAAAVARPRYRAAIVAALEVEARLNKCRSVILLTTTAQPLFEKLGYAVLDRAQAPSALARERTVLLAVSGDGRADDQAARLIGELPACYSRRSNIASLARQETFRATTPTTPSEKTSTILEMILTLAY